MLSENDKQNLIRNLAANRLVLVTGAGFSHDALNSSGASLPDGNQLASALWTFLYGDEWDKRTQLKTLYGAALTHPKGLVALRHFMSSQLGVASYAAWYRDIPKWFWYRIYSFNADNLLETVYRDSGTELSTLVGPCDYEERDQFLRRTQYIKLHGSIDSTKPLTFAPREYASRAAASVDIWYLHFVGDYATLPTIFIGTQLDEPVFWQYIEMRGSQNLRGAKVRRAKCFLVSPNISKPMAQMLAPYNIVPVQATGEAFFSWLAEQHQPLNREETLRLTHEGQELAIQAARAGRTNVSVSVIEYFFSVFSVPARPTNPRRSSMFLFGAPPTWEDIANDIDAERTINSQVVKAIKERFRDDTFDLAVITSAAGGGKSTVLKRVALELVDEGYPVFFSDGRMRPDVRKLTNYLKTLRQKTILIFDNAGDDLNLIADLWQDIHEHEHAPILLVAARSNDFAFRSQELLSIGARVREFPVPDLSLQDIQAILEKLEQYNALGVLVGKSAAERISLFQKKSRNQILVAMREVTTGRGFDDILRDEYSSLDSDNAKLLYLVSAIASDDDYGLSQKQMILALEIPPSEAMLLLEKSLSGILLQHEFDATSYYVRHPAIAFFILQNAPRAALAEALVALMLPLAMSIPSGWKERKVSRAARVYRRIMNHSRMQVLFPRDPELARSVYERLEGICKGDGHYWLHFASFEIEHGGNLTLAESYLQNADPLWEGNRQVFDVTVAHLLFKKALAEETAFNAEPLIREAQSILRTKMADKKTITVHSLHLYGSQTASCIRKWTKPPKKAEEFRQARLELEAAIPNEMNALPMLQTVLRDLQRGEIESALPAPL